ncbi:MAG: hypothetical protein JW839_05155 [Candidatus Lokiarchaeota archaeon]|nr:hypothetical protein [Candidatus Lokiarchaeota archaeon]
MPDLLKMDRLVETLEKTVETLNRLSERLAASMDNMTETLAKTHDTIEHMGTSIDSLSQRTSTAIEGMNGKFDKLISTLVNLSKDSPLLNPRSVVSSAKDIVSDILKR